MIFTPQEEVLRFKVRRKPNDYESAYALALLLADRKAPQAQHYFRIGANSPNPDHRAGYANMLVMQGKCMEAVAIYKPILDGDRNHLASLVGASIAMFILQEFKAAESFAKKAERVAPELTSLHENNLALIRGKAASTIRPVLWWPHPQPDLALVN